MQIEPLQKLSRRSKGILYQFKSALKQFKRPLKSHIEDAIGSIQYSFSQKQFELIIRRYDQYLVGEQIDLLFDNIKNQNSNKVSYQTFEKILSHIGEEDNPKMVLEHFKKQSHGNQLEELEIVIEIKNLLDKTGDYFKTLDLFLNDEEGYYEKQDILELLANLNFKDEKKIKKFIGMLFNHKEQIHINNVLQIFGFQYRSMRIKENQSRHQSPVKRQKVEEEVMIERKKSNKKINQISLSYKSYGKSKLLFQKQIPESLKRCFNYNSELQVCFAKFANQIIRQNQLFIDPNNPLSTRAERWVHVSQLFQKSNFSVFQIAQSVFNRQKNRKGAGLLLEPHDIRQGKIGDCYFLSGIASIVNKYPELLLKLFVFDKNESHLFGVRLFVDGVWKTFSLDGRFPVNGKGKLLGVHPHHQEIWVMLLEKAWAKHFKSYDVIRSGFSAEGLQAISGAPIYVLSTNDKVFVPKIKQFIKNGYVMTCASSGKLLKKTKEERKSMGILAKHSYTILDIFFDVPFKNVSITLFKVRNPWGRYPWLGNWSFNCKNWTPKLRKRLNYEQDPQDGSFFISLLDFKVVFGRIFVSYLKKNYINSWTTIKSNRYDFHETQLNIKIKGLYYFTIYQDNPRIYRNVMKYKKSKSWFFLSKIERGKERAIVSRSQDFKNNLVEVNLEPGNYVIFSKVHWKYWNDHEYTLTSYGPSKVNFSSPIISHGTCLNGFIESKSQKEGGKQKKYPNTLIYKSFFFNNKMGYGYLTLKNKDPMIFQTEISFNPCKGIQILEPHNFPLNLTVLPQQRVTVKFLVDPNGFSYKFKQKFVLSKPKK